MKECGKKDTAMDKESSIGPMVGYTMANTHTTSLMAMVHILGQKVSNTTVSGAKERCMAWVYTPGPTVVDMKDSTYKVKDRVKGSCSSLMVTGMMEAGYKESVVVKGSKFRT